MKKEQHLAWPDLQGVLVDMITMTTTLATLALMILQGASREWEIAGEDRDRRNIANRVVSSTTNCKAKLGC